jgi:DivIVA domain-containing protein
MVSEQPPEPAEEASGEALPSPAPGEEAIERRNVTEEIGDASFSVSVRGYDRGAVDAYVSRVQALIAELEQTRSPEAAVKHALEQVGEQTKGVLEQAGQTAEEIIAAARHDAQENIAGAKREADEIVAEAKAEAEEILTRSQTEAEATVAGARTEAADELQRSREEVTALREEAEAHVRELRADADAIQQERSRLLADIREITTRVEEVASAANVRFPPPEAAEQAEEVNLTSEGDAAESERIATDEPTVADKSRPHSSS